jgi:hypothetical protein
MQPAITGDMMAGIKHAARANLNVAMKSARLLLHRLRRKRVRGLPALHEQKRVRTMAVNVIILPVAE